MITIGLCANWNEKEMRSDIPNNYVKAVLEAGGLPIVFPICGDEKIWKAMIDLADGVIFAGGSDVCPAVYGEETHKETNGLVLERDNQEYWMMNYVKQTRRPFLGICRGSQVMNTNEKGSLYQHLAEQHPSDINHAQFDRHAETIHPVKVVEGTRFHQIVGKEELMVNSCHHQGFKRIGNNLTAAAIAPDGLVEAIEFTDGTLGIGVQWHPEWLYMNDPAMKNLFAWLLNEAKKFQDAR